MLAFDLSDISGPISLPAARGTTVPTPTSKPRSRKVKISEGTTRLWRANDWDTIVRLRKQVLEQAKKNNCDVDIVDCNDKVIYTAHPKDEE